MQEVLCVLVLMLASRWLCFGSVETLGASEDARSVVGFVGRWSLGVSAEATARHEPFDVHLLLLRRRELHGGGVCTAALGRWDGSGH